MYRTHTFIQDLYKCMGPIHLYRFCINIWDPYTFIWVLYKCVGPIYPYKIRKNARLFYHLWPIYSTHSTFGICISARRPYVQMNCLCVRSVARCSSCAWLTSLAKNATNNKSLIYKKKTRFIVLFHLTPEKVQSTLDTCCIRASSKLSHASKMCLSDYYYIRSEYYFLNGNQCWHQQLQKQGRKTALL